MASERYEAVRVVGWPGKETVVAEGDTAEELLLKLMEKTGCRNYEEVKSRAKS